MKPSNIYKHDRPPLLSQMNVANSELLKDALNLTDSDILRNYVLKYSGMIPSALGIAILESWENNIEVSICVAQKVQLDDTVLIRFGKNWSSFVKLTLLGRKDLSSRQLAFLAGKMEFSGDRAEIATAIVDHPNVDTEALQVLWQRSNALHPYLLRRRNLPKEFQSFILRVGGYLEKLDLMKQANTNQEIRMRLTETFISESLPSIQIDLLRHCELPKEFIAEQAQSKNFRVAAAAADRLSESSSLIRVRDFVYRHAGFRFAPLQRLITEHISNGLPLGWFVFSCYILRKIVPVDPPTFSRQIFWIKSQPRAVNIRTLAICTDEELEAFDRVLSVLSIEQRKRLGLKSLHIGELNSDLILRFALIDKEDKSGFSFNKPAIAKIEYLSKFLEEYRCQLNIFREKNVWFKPTVKTYWSWLSKLDGQVLASGHKVRVVRSSHALRKLGATLRNCLNRDYSIENVLAGDVVILALRKNKMDEFAVEIRTSNPEITQFYGPRNTTAPAKVKVMLESAFQAVVRERS